MTTAAPNPSTLYTSPSGRYRVDADRITDTRTGRSAPIQHASVAIVTAELLESYDLPGTPDPALDRLRVYEAIREDQRAEDDAARRSSAYDCPQCGEPTDTLREGCCEPCRDENQRALDEHNLAFDRWEAMPDSARAEVIRRAAR